MTDRNDPGESWNEGEPSTTQEPLVAVASRLSGDSMTVESSEAATELIEETAETPLQKQILPAIRPIAEDAPELVGSEIDVLATALTDEELGNDPHANAAWALTALHEIAPTEVSTAISSRFDVLADDVPPDVHLGFHLNDALDALDEEISSD